MNEAPLEPRHRALLIERHFHEPFPREAVADLLEVLHLVTLAPGEMLLAEGEPGNDMYLVLAGTLQVRVDRPGGGATVLDEVVPGGVVGEMALLTGQPRTATVAALTGAELARLARVDFERLAARHPDALNEFLRRILPRMRRTQLVRVLEELFGPLGPEARCDLEAELAWQSLPGGAVLFAEGEAGTDVYIVVNGRLRITATDGEGRTRLLEEVGRGAAVGELGLLTGEPRAATVIAARDTDLLRLTRHAFDRLLARHPQAMIQIARAAAVRLRESGRRPRRHQAPRSFALVAASPDVPLAELAVRLEGALAAYGGAASLGSRDVDRLLAKPGIAQTPEDSALHASIVAWLAAQERERAFLVLVADAQWTPWTRRCLREADRVLLVARADADPAPGHVEQELAAMKLPVRCELVLLDAGGAATPIGTGAWLAPRELAEHHHVRLADDADLRRLARRISGRAHALVLGGGGARGFAHIGVLRALAEAGFEVDLVGGTSIGSVIAAAHAAGLTPAEMVAIASSFASRKALLDRTLPVVSLMAGRKLTALFQRVYGDRTIEDLRTPLFVVSSGLTRAEAVVHRRGPLWRAVRASTAVPAIFPPMLDDDGQVLVDGNVMNNMPLDVMREWCEGGTLVGVNPMPVQDKVRRYRFGSSLSGWEALKGRFHLFGSTTRAPGIFGAIMRATEINSANRMRQPAFRALADLLIEPPVGGFAIMGYGAYEPIIELGYQAARQALAKWRDGHEAHERPATQDKEAASQGPP